MYGLYPGIVQHFCQWLTGTLKLEGQKGVQVIVQWLQLYQFAALDHFTYRGVTLAEFVTQLLLTNQDDGKPGV
ncbi:Uncharacterised protein [Salmonella enterica subsp. salamae]|nr:Uncharacterised protein [Salmonella enterica subsp. salamae]